MRRVTALVFLFVTAVFSAQVEIATYNVENLFDCKNDGSECDDFRVGGGEWDCAAASAKISRVKEAILALNTDIIALQEIENESVLKELASGTQYKYVVFSGGKGAPVGLGLISKVRPTYTQNFVVPNVKTRNILRVDFETEGKNFSVFVNHFPAYKNGVAKQEKAERTLRAAIRDVKNAVVLGDFNTPYGSRSLLNKIIETGGFVDLWEFLEASERYSHQVGNKKSAIDHVLLAPEFFVADGAGMSYVKGSFEVFKPKFMLDSEGKNRIENGKSAYSDHFALKFKLSTEPAREDVSLFKKIFGVKGDNDAPQEDVKQAPASGSEYSPASVDDIFAAPQKTPFFLNRAVVVYKDKNGFVLASNHRGIYVFDPQNKLALGQMLDVLVTKTKIYKDALEVASYEIRQIWDVVEPGAFMLSADHLSEARDGDVIDEISGEVKSGYLISPQGKIRVYSPNKRIYDAKNASFSGALVKSYKGEKQLYIERK